MKILITICARGGSKGIPGKNIKQINGKPLIAYSIDLAKSFQAAHPNVDIELSTDADEIVKVAAYYGLFSNYRRTPHLADDKAGKIPAIEDLLLYAERINQTKYDFVLDLDVTSPLRNIKDLNDAFALIDADENALNLFSVNDANRNPYFNMVEQQRNGYYGLVKSLGENIMSRQAAPNVYELNASFYFYRRLFFEKGYDSAITEKSLIYKMPHICFDLDHPIDFEIMSFLVNNDKLDFSL